MPQEPKTPTRIRYDLGKKLLADPATRTRFGWAEDFSDPFQAVEDVYAAAERNPKIAARLKNWEATRGLRAYTAPAPPVTFGKKLINSAAFGLPGFAWHGITGGDLIPMEEERANPTAATAGSIAGFLGTMFVPGMVLPKLAKAAAGGGAAVKALTRGASWITGPQRIAHKIATLAAKAPEAQAGLAELRALKPVSNLAHFSTIGGLGGAMGIGANIEAQNRGMELGERKDFSWPSLGTMALAGALGAPTGGAITRGILGKVAPTLGSTGQMGAGALAGALKAPLAWNVAEASMKTAQDPNKPFLEAMNEASDPSAPGNWALVGLGALGGAVNARGPAALTKAAQRTAGGVVSPAVENVLNQQAVPNPVAAAAAANPGAVAPAPGVPTMPPPIPAAISRQALMRAIKTADAGAPSRFSNLLSVFRGTARGMREGFHDTLAGLKRPHDVIHGTPEKPTITRYYPMTQARIPGRIQRPGGPIEQIEMGGTEAVNAGSLGQLWRGDRQGEFGILRPGVERFYGRSPNLMDATGRPLKIMGFTKPIDPQTKEWDLNNAVVSVWNGTEQQDVPANQLPAQAAEAIMAQIQKYMPSTSKQPIPLKTGPQSDILLELRRMIQGIDPEDLDVIRAEAGQQEPRILQLINWLMPPPANP